MRGPALIINTHPRPNPEFVNPLTELLEELRADYHSLSGYQPLDVPTLRPSCVLLTGVPLTADYSLSDPETQNLVEEYFGWLKDYTRPLLGICYGHQIIAHILGGAVSPLAEPIFNPRLEIQLPGTAETGIFQGFYRLRIFAEHRDYVSRVPEDLRVLSALGAVPYLIRHPGRDWYGCQFVPERSGQHTRKILRRFLLAHAPCRRQG